MSTQRVYVSTHRVEGGYPFFRVDSLVSDDFIDREIERRFGRQADGNRHQWEAFNESDLEAAGAGEGVEAA